MGSVVYQTANPNGPFTHAMVIGVSSYDHLPGGKGPLFGNHGGMTQLSSPAHSAREFARWLIESYHHPEKPLGTVSLLISDPVDTPFEFDTGNTHNSVNLTPATMAEADKAIKQWRIAGDQDPENFLIFYFCGHGIARGTDLGLLLSDFGKDALAPLNGSINFHALYRGMDESAARDHIYFVDACRTASELLVNNEGFVGLPIIQKSGLFGNPTRARKAPIFYSTLAGAQAYALPGKSSVFTASLLRAISGLGSSDEEGSWRIKTTRLHEALDFLMQEESIKIQLRQAQIPISDSLTTIVMNEVDVPQDVPVQVWCEPASAQELAILKCENAQTQHQSNPSKDPWRLQLPVGIYNFAATFQNNEYQTKNSLNQLVRPPYRNCSLRVVDE